MKKLIVATLTMMISLPAMAAMLDTVDITVEVGAGSGSFLTVEPASIDFGTVNTTPSAHRYGSNIMTCEFYAANAPWSIEVSANNPTNLSGLVAQSGSDYYNIPLKFWTANYGGVGDPTDDNEWTGVNSVFRWVLDDEESFIFKLGSSAEESTSPTPFKFAIDAQGALQADYSSQITLELVIE